MSGVLSPSILGEGNVMPEVPTFIHEIPGSEASNPFERFNFWAPARLGEAGQDYAAGQRHFETALAFARAGQLTNLIANIVGGMCACGAGPMERGFLDVLSRKATYGRAPDPIGRGMADLVIQLCGHPEEEIRFGESEARRCLEIARECQWPELIEGLMVDIVKHEMGYGALTFMWTVCGAAYLGAAN